MMQIIPASNEIISSLYMSKSYHRILVAPESGPSWGLLVEWILVIRYVLPVLPLSVKNEEATCCFVRILYLHQHPLRYLPELPLPFLHIPSSFLSLNLLIRELILIPIHSLMWLNFQKIPNLGRRNSGIQQAMVITRCHSVWKACHWSSVSFKAAHPKIRSYTVRDLCNVA